MISGFGPPGAVPCGARARPRESESWWRVVESDALRTVLSRERDVSGGVVAMNGVPGAVAGELIEVSTDALRRWWMFDRDVAPGGKVGDLRE